MVAGREAQSAKLRPHTTGVGCLPIEDSQKVDLNVLREIIGDTPRASVAGNSGELTRNTSHSAGGTSASDCAA